MDTIRLVSAGHSPRVRQVVAALAGFPAAVKILGDSSDPVQLMMQVRTQHAQVVVLDTDDRSLLGSTSHLLAEFPELVILGVGSKGSFIEQLCPRRTAVRPRSATGIVEALRRAVSDPCT